MPKNAILEWFGHFPESSKRRAAGYFGGGFLGAELGRILGRNELTRFFFVFFGFGFFGFFCFSFFVFLNF